MKQATITITFDKNKLDALVFHMEKKDIQMQYELNDTVQKLYEKYVPQPTREYLEDKISRELASKAKKEISPKPQTDPETSVMRSYDSE